MASREAYTSHEALAGLLAWGALGFMALAIIVSPWFVVGCVICFCGSVAAL